MTFIRRHFWYILLGVVGLGIVYLLSAFLEPFKEGINPFVFVLKIFAKLAYVGAAVMCTHFVIKKFFPTINEYCSTCAGQVRSHFMDDWDEHFQAIKKRRAALATDPQVEVPELNPKIGIAIGVHVGVFIGITVLLALAF